MKTHELVENLVRNTILDARIADRYLPLQVWVEYQAYEAGLTHYLMDEAATVQVVVPVRASESAIPLVSLIVWAKAVQLEHLGAKPGRVAPVWLFGGMTVGDDAGRGMSHRARRICTALGARLHEKPSGELLGEVDADPVVGPIAQRLIETYRAQGDKRLSSAQLASLLDAVTLVSYCALRRGTMVLCGQDQAPLLNTLAQELAKQRGEGGLSLPIGLYMPFIPFTDRSPILLDDSPGVVEDKVLSMLREAGGRAQQLALARDLMALTVATGLLSAPKSAWPTFSEAETLTEVGRPLAQWIYDWMQTIKTAASPLGVPRTA